jgi:2-dehydropantoate 2-reductase
MAQAVLDVTFVARGEHLQTMLKHGLKVKSIHGDFQVANLKATDRIRDLENPDLVIIGVKAWQIKEIRDELKAIIHPESIIIPLQNGISAADELLEVIDRKNVLGGSCRIFSRIESPGVIEHFGVTPAIIFGELDKSDTPRLSSLKSLFDYAGIANRIAADIESELWIKFINICVGGLLAVTRTTYGELRELTETRQMMSDLLYEIYHLSQKIGIAIEPGFVERSIAAIDSWPYDSTPSLARDVWAGRPSEIEYQNGTVVKLGEKHNVDTPVNRFVYNCILPMEMKARKKM